MKEIGLRIISAIMNYGLIKKDYFLENIKPEYFNAGEQRITIGIVLDLLNKNIEPNYENISLEYSKRGIEKSKWLKKIELEYFDITEEELLENVSKIQQKYYWEQAEIITRRTIRKRVAGEDATFALLALSKEINDLLMHDTVFGDSTQPAGEELEEFVNRLAEIKAGKLESKKLIYFDNFPTMRKSGGLDFGDLVLISGRFKSGKTTISLAMMLELLFADYSVAMISLEMKKEGNIFPKLLSQMTSVDYDTIRNQRMHEITAEQLEELKRFAAMLKTRRLYLAEKAKTPALIETQLRRWSVEGVNVVFIDYLQLIQFPKAEREELAIGDFTASLKTLAGELNMLIVLLVQENKEGGTRGSDAPLMDADLRLSTQMFQPNDNGDTTLDNGMVISGDKPIIKITCKEARNAPSGWWFYATETKSGFKELAIDRF